MAEGRCGWFLGGLEKNWYVSWDWYWGGRRTYHFEGEEVVVGITCEDDGIKKKSW